MGPKRIIDYPTISSLAGDDYITVWKSSEGKQKKISGTNLVFIPTKSVDANGWTVYDYGTYKEYSLTVPVNVNVASGTRSGQIAVAPPVGRTLAQLQFFTSWYGGYGGHAVTGAEAASSNLAVEVGNQYSGGTLNFNGNIEVTARER